MIKRKHFGTFLSCQKTGIILLVGILLSCNTNHTTYIFPDKEFPELFRDVQISKVFSDDKSFPDYIPKSSSWIINTKYRWWKLFHNKNEVKLFVSKNFYLPPLYIDSINYKGDIREHILEIYDKLLIKKEKQQNGSSLISLPYDFVIPGGRFREIYYWDTYFTLIGYAVQDKKDIVYKVTENIAYLINKFGFMPNGNRSYYLSRSQPPFFSLIVELNADLMGDTIYTHYLPAMEKEYKYWTDNQVNAQVYRHIIKLNDTVTLNRYFDNLNIPRVEMYQTDVETFIKFKEIIKDTTEFYRNIRTTAESGWDFSSRWFEGNLGIASLETLDILPVDLNCLLYHLEKTIARAYKIKNHPKQSEYNTLALERKNSINRYFWSDTAGFYFDYNYKNNKLTGKYTLAGIFPLFMGIADSMQAFGVSKKIRQLFLKHGGVVTTLTNSGEQWDYPNGWAPLQWITIKGLNKYQYKSLADTIKVRWLSLNKLYFNKTHKMIEKYNVVDTLQAPHDGEYPTQDGFGWTNGVYLGLKYQE